LVALRFLAAGFFAIFLTVLLSSAGGSRPSALSGIIGAARPYGQVRAPAGHGERREMSAMQELIARAEKVARRLKDRGETIVVAESSTGGLLSAALLALPGASAYFLGGAVVYTQVARRALLDLPDIAALGMRASTEPYARLLAQTSRQRFAASWALAESGATGPSGNRYGDAPGHSCIAVAGPTERSITLETGSADRVANMRAFGAAALDLLLDVLAE
jgi:PncC family amidohydrolase